MALPTWIILSFPYPLANGPGDDALVIETTWGTYPLESADVYASQNGVDWTYAGTVDNAGTTDVPLPAALPWVLYVKIVDITNPAPFSGDGDGFDLDATGAYYVTTTVYIDLKPGSWPNPINVHSRGTFAVAICGTAILDVTTIDPASVTLHIEGVEGGVSPLRWSYEDVATPYTGAAEGGHALDGDGYMDLVLHFDTQEAVYTLGLASHAGETIPLTLTGSLKEEFGATPIQGQDHARILRIRGASGLFFK